MPRIRTIKPEFQQSESMGKISREARLTFILLWPQADDFGRTRAPSRMLASILYPYDDDAPNRIDGWLDELEAVGSIRRYSIDGHEYIDIPKWQDHQKVDHPQKSKHPEFREGSRRLAKAREYSGLDQGPRTKDQGKDQVPKNLLLYAFEGKIIKVTKEDFDRWQTEYPLLNGTMRSFLESRDAWYAQPENASVRRNWLPATIRALSQENLRLKGEAPKKHKPISNIRAGTPEFDKMYE